MNRGLLVLWNARNFVSTLTAYTESSEESLGTFAELEFEVTVTEFVELRKSARC